MLEAIAAVFLDALSSLWLVGAMGSYFAAKQLDTGEGGIMNALHFWAGVFGVFVFMAGILTFAVAVPAFMLLPLVQSANVDPKTLLTSGWMARTFGLMVLCQIPGFVQRVRHLSLSGVAPEKMGMDAETGFVLHRTVMLTAMGTMLAAFGSYALHLTVILAQAIGAGSEIMRDKYVGILMASRHPAPIPTRPTPKLRRWRRRRR